MAAILIQLPAGKIQLSDNKHLVNHRVELEFIQPGKPTQNSYIERFYVFSRLSGVKEITDDWIEQYKQERPHEALNNLTPVEYLIANSPEISTFSWH